MPNILTNDINQVLKKDCIKCVCVCILLANLEKPGARKGC